MTEKRSLPLDDRGALDTARGAERAQREETLRGFAGIRFSSVQRGAAVRPPTFLIALIDPYYLADASRMWDGQG